MKPTIYQKVAIGFGLGLLLLIIIGIASYRFTTDFSASAEMRKHTYEVIINIEHVSSLLNDIQADVRGYVITGQDSILYLYPSKVKMINQKIKTIEELSSKEHDHQKLAETIKPMIAQLIEFNRQVIETRKKQGHETAVDLVMTGKGEQLMKDIEKLISELTEEEFKLLKQRDESLRVVARTTKNIIVAGSLLAIAIVIISVVVIWRELTRRKQAEEALQKAHDELEIKVQERTAHLAKSNEALLKANRAYRTLSECNQVLVRAKDESVLLDDICRIIVEAGGYRMALIGYAEQDEQKTVRAVAQMGYEENFFKTVNLTWADTERGHGPLGTAIRTRTPSIFHDIANESKIASWREAALKRGYSSAIGLPLVIDSGLLGALAIYSVEPYAFDEEEIKLLTEMADDLSYGIMTIRARAEHKKAEEVLRASEEKYKTLFESAGEGILIADIETAEFKFANPAICKMLGYSKEELLRLGISDIHPKDALEHVISEFKAQARGEKTLALDIPCLRKDGTIIYTDINTTKVLLDGRECNLGFFTDTTERKKAEEELKLFRTLIDRSNDTIEVVDPGTGCFLDVNEKGCTDLGYSRKEFLSLKVSDIDPNMDTSSYKRVVEELRKAGFARLESLHRRKDGAMIPVEINMKYVQLDRDYIVTVVRDITERKQAVEALREIRDYLENLLTHTNAPSIVWDPRFRIARFNHAFEYLTGYLAHEVIGKELHILFPEESKEESLHKIERTLSGEYWKSVEIPILCKGGDIRIALWNSANIYTEDGKTLLATIAQGQDITERKQAVEALKRSHDELEIRVRERTKELEDVNLEFQVVNVELIMRRQEADTATRAKSEFLANMSHELRTPLNSIIGFSDMMFQGMTGKLTEQQHEYLGDIRESGELLLSIINDILDLSKVEAGKMELEISEFSVKDLIERSMILFKEKAMKHRIKLTVEVAPDAALIEADGRKIKQVIANILSNAVKFTPDGGTVYVRARKQTEDEKIRSYEVEKKLSSSELLNFSTSAGFIEISVEDTGIGIRPEDINKLFQPFQQLEYALDKKYEGTGLGLALCKKIVELHHGRIWVESEVGKGSKFTFVIPAKQKT